MRRRTAPPRAVEPTPTGGARVTITLSPMLLEGILRSIGDEERYYRERINPGGSRSYYSGTFCDEAIVDAVAGSVFLRLAREGIVDTEKHELVAGCAWGPPEDS